MFNIYAQQKYQEFREISHLSFESNIGKSILFSARCKSNTNSILELFMLWSALYYFEVTFTIWHVIIWLSFSGISCHLASLWYFTNALTSGQLETYFELYNKTRKAPPNEYNTDDQ